MQIALKELLNNLDKIEVEHDEIFDTAVREEMYTAIEDNFVMPESVSSNVGTYFAMFSDEGNAKVAKVLTQFLNHPDVIATGAKLSSPQARLDAFQDETIESDEGNMVEDYFGYAELP